MTTSVFDVAEYVLKKCVAAGDHAISAMKLQKLVYYCQAYRLA
ncbi:MAG: hypothetical protein ACTHWF_05820 [Brachybacterium sp.]